MAKSKTKKDDPIKEAKKFLEDFPTSYDAHRDGLTDVWDHKETVNKLLHHLRAVLARM